MTRRITKNDLPRLMTTEEVAESLRLAEGTLRKWRSAGRGPKFVKLGNDLVRYLPEDIADYARDHRVHALED